MRMIVVECYKCLREFDIYHFELIETFDGFYKADCPRCGMSLVDVIRREDDDDD